MPQPKAKPASEYPFYVRVKDGVPVQGHSTVQEAEADAKERNRRAEEMQLKARYETVTN